MKQIIILFALVGCMFTTGCGTLARSSKVPGGNLRRAHIAHTNVRVRQAIQATEERGGDGPLIMVQGKEGGGNVSLDLLKLPTYWGTIMTKEGAKALSLDTFWSAVYGGATYAAYEGANALYEEFNDDDKKKSDSPKGGKQVSAEGEGSEVTIESELAAQLGEHNFKARDGGKVIIRDGEKKDDDSDED